MHDLEGDRPVEQRVAQVRVRANNGRFAGPWVSGPVFSIEGDDK